MNSKAFTLLEVIVAIFVLTVGLGATLALIQQTLVSSSLVEDKLIASYLAQEGMELVRNIRDTNWLEGRTATNSWDEGLTACSTGCIVDYKHSYGPNQLDPVLPGYANQFLNIDTNGFYSYSPGTQTKFKRAIVISSLAADEMKVFVKVEWTERGRTHTIEAVEHLYNWYGQ